MTSLTPHRRWNPLKEEWVLVSPHRVERPWQGALETGREERLPDHDSTCYLCPGNSRAGGKVNPSYSSIFAFDNDFPSLLPESSGDGDGAPSFIRSSPERGRCRVLCFSPLHNQTMAEMGTKEILEVIDAWEGETKELARQKDISHVMIFENKGAMMGCSNPHPHCQIWATENIPDIPRRILDSEKRYFASHSSHILADYVRWELEKGERLVAKNDHWVALVPYWAVWPFEVMMLPVTGSPASIEQLSSEQREGWSALLRDVLTRYDNLFQSSFPYSMGVYQKPVTGGEYSYHTLHQSFFPPLLRSREVKKHMVGYELCAEPQRDLTPELAAAKLRESGGVHYRRKR